MTYGYHECPVPGCRVEISNKFALCRPHWFGLPQRERAIINRSLRNNGPGTREHVATIEGAVRETYGEHGE